jgi:hypothetical protein
MAGSTYLDLVNRVIRRINEVELTETSFASARGMQAVVKDAVRDAVYEINQQKWEWPYHAYQNAQVLQIGENEYSWPLDFKSVDWNSFQIRKDTALNINNTHLAVIDRNEWYTYMKDADEDNYPNGTKLPHYVFKAHGNGFGVAPAPDKAYTVEFRYYRNENPLVIFSDVTDIPSEFDNVITMGALYHMNLFRENQQGVAIAQDSFTKGIKAMYSILVGEVSPYVSTTVLNNTGIPTLNGGGRDNYKL